MTGFVDSLCQDWKASLQRWNLSTLNFSIWSFPAKKGWVKWFQQHLQQQESILHVFFGCDFNSEAGKFLIKLVKVYDPSITEEKAVRFQIQTDALYELSSTLMLYSGLFLFWNNRLSKKRTSIFSTRAELGLLVVTLRKSRLRMLREAGSIIQNTLDFLVVA